MTKRNYAAIMSAKDTAREIKKLTDEVKEKGVTKAYKAVMRIAELNDKWLNDFENVNPAWTPDNAQQGQYQKRTYRTPAPAYEKETYK